MKAKTKSQKKHTYPMVNIDSNIYYVFLFQVKQLKNIHIVSIKDY